MRNRWLQDYSLRNIGNKEKWFLWISFFYIIYNVFPLFADVFHIPVAIPAIMVAVGLIILYPRESISSKAVKWFFVYIIILEIYGVLDSVVIINGLGMKEVYWRRIIIEAAWILPSLMIVSVLHSLDNDKLYAIIAYGAFIFILVSFLIILPLMKTSVGYLRDEIHNMEESKPLGLPDYALMHAYTSILVLVCVNVRRGSVIQRCFFVAAGALVGFVIIRTSVTTSLVVMLLIILLSIIYNSKNVGLTLVSIPLLGVIILLLYNDGYFTQWIESLMPYFEGTSVYSKLDDIHQSLIQGTITGGTLKGRMNYHQMSVESFYEHPLFGCDSVEGIGGHSKILDILGGMGLTVFIPFILIILSSLNEALRKVKEPELKYFVLLSYLVAFVYLYQKGIFGGPGWLFMTVLIPCGIIALRRKDKDDIYYTNTRWRS